MLLVPAQRLEIIDDGMEEMSALVRTRSVLMEDQVNRLTGQTAALATLVEETMARSEEMYDMRLKADTSTQDLLKSLMARNIELFDEERTRNRGQTYLISQDSLEQKTKANCLEPPEPRGRGRDKH